MLQQASILDPKQCVASAEIHVSQHQLVDRAYQDIDSGWRQRLNFLEQLQLPLLVPTIVWISDDLLVQYLDRCKCRSTPRAI